MSSETIDDPCWIGGEPPGSREHRFKKSDLKSHLGEFSSARPLWRREKGTPPKVVQGVNSDSLKFDAPMCGPCNNYRTQPYDLAWQALSTYIGTVWDNNVHARRVWLSEAFSNTSVQRQAELVHLYFLKLFGCRAIEAQSGLEMAPLARHLREGTVDPRLFVVLGHTAGLNDKPRYAHVTPLVIQDDQAGVVRCAFALFTVGRMSLELLYVPKTTFPPPVRGAWNPSWKSGVIKLVEFSYVVDASTIRQRAAERFLQSSAADRFEVE